MSQQLGRLMTIIVEALDERGTVYSRIDDESLMVRIQGNHGTYDVLLVADDELEQVGCLCIFGSRVPPDRRHAMAEMVTRANYGLRIGNFEMDFTDGELRFRAGVDVEGGLLGAEMVHNMIGLSLSMNDRHHDAFMRVMFGDAEPQDALATIDA